MIVTYTYFVQQLNHLNSSQKTQLQAVFEKHKRVFDGTLGCHPTAEIDIELVPGAKPIYQRPYPVPFQKQEQFNKELKSMIADGVFRSIGESKWGFPSFIAPKKDGQVRWLSDFRKLNASTVRKPCPLPKTQDIMLKRWK